MSDAAPLRRPNRPDSKPSKDDPVEVDRVEGGTSMGVVKSINTTHGQRTVVVETGEGELVTSGGRVRRLTGQIGKQIRRDVGDDND